MANQYVNKLILGNETLFDISGDTATAADVAQGKTFHLASGAPAVGTASGGGGGSATILKSIIERTAVTSPTLPDDLTKIGDYVFYNYSSFALTSLPSGITSIGKYAFNGCTALALASLPSGMTSIGNFAFYGCSNISLTSLPSGITTIGASAFQNCTNIALTSLPSGVTSIGGNAFNNCPNVVLTSLPSGLTSVGNTSFSGTGITSMVIPSGLTSIFDAFKNCKHLTSISGNSVTSMSGGGLSGCTSLVDARFPNYSSVLGTSAFGSCNNLAVADIGSAPRIYPNAFSSCYKLQTLVLRKTGSICTLDNVSAFLNTPMRGYNSLTGTVYVPSALISSYQTATNWKTLYDGGTLTFAAIEGSQYAL